MSYSYNPNHRAEKELAEITEKTRKKKMAKIWAIVGFSIGGVMTAFLVFAKEIIEFIK